MELPENYLKNLKECAAARHRTLYAWVDEHGPKSAVHRTMVPFDTPLFWVVKPSGHVSPISGGY